MRNEPTSELRGGGVESPAVLCGLASPGTIQAIYLDHAMLLRGVAVRKFGVPPADAEALVHDVFIAYLTSARPVRKNLRGYLVAAICNASRNYWRSRRTEARVFTDDGSDTAEMSIADDSFESLTFRLLIAAILSKLGSRCSEVLRRYYLNGEETRSIAEAFGTTSTNVNYLMHICRKRARDAYEAISGKY